MENPIFDYNVSFYNSGTECKWAVFVEDKRGSVGKLVAILNEENKSGFVKSLALKPACRGYEVGLVLLESCKQFLRDDVGYQFVDLEAEEDMGRYGKLVNYYERAGFQQIDSPSDDRIVYKGEETYRAIRMRCVLHFAESLIGKTMYLGDALILAGNLDAYIHVAMLAKAESHPDWVQFMILVRHLYIPFRVASQARLPPVALEIIRCNEFGEQSEGSARMFEDIIKRITSVPMTHRHATDSDRMYCEKLVSKYTLGLPWEW